MAQIVSETAIFILPGGVQRQNLDNSHCPNIYGPGCIKPYILQNWITSVNTKHTIINFIVIFNTWLHFPCLDPTDIMTFFFGALMLPLQSIPLHCLKKCTMRFKHCITHKYMGYILNSETQCVSIPAVQNRDSILCDNSFTCVCGRCSLQISYGSCTLKSNLEPEDSWGAAWCSGRRNALLQCRPRAWKRQCDFLESSRVWGVCRLFVYSRIFFWGGVFQCCSKNRQFFS